MGTPLWSEFVRLNAERDPLMCDGVLCQKCYQHYSANQQVNVESQIQQNSQSHLSPIPHCSRYPPPLPPPPNPAVQLPAPSFQPQPISRIPVPNLPPPVFPFQTQTTSHHQDTLLRFSGNPAAGHSLSVPDFQVPPSQQHVSTFEQAAGLPIANGFRQNINPNQNVPTERILSVVSCEGMCCVCDDERGRSRIDHSIRRQVWSIGKIMIPFGNRICPAHRQDQGLLDAPSVNRLQTRAQYKQVASQEVIQYLGTVLATTFTEDEDNDSSFVLDVLKSDNDCKCYTGLSVAHYLDFCSGIRIQGFSQERTRKAVALLLATLRMNNSQDQLGKMFGLTQPTVSKYIDAALTAADAQFVPHYLGFNHISRAEYANHMTTMTQVLHEIQPNSLAYVLDGTYFEIDQSSNYLYQKATWNLHKHYNLVKAMVICAPDGYILDVFCITACDNLHNDAALFNHMIESPGGFSDFFNAGDVVIVDRGFRDSVDLCEDFGLQVKMPTLLGGRKQFPLDEANFNRKVTKVRWIVEAVHGRLKRVFRFFANKICNSYLPKLAKFIRVACALLNKYFPPIYPDNPAQLEIANYMLQRCRESDHFYQTLEGLGLLHSNANWRLTNIENMDQFPRLSEQDLTDITAGVYQLKEAPSYVALHTNRVLGRHEPIESFELFTHLEYDQLLMVKMESRHVANKKYKLFIAYMPGQNGPHGIHAYYCTCQTGMRTVGMCSHVAAVMWLLGFAYRNNAVYEPAANLAEHLFHFRL